MVPNNQISAWLHKRRFIKIFLEWKDVQVAFRPVNKALGEVQCTQGPTFLRKDTMTCLACQDGDSDVFGCFMFEYSSP